MATQCQPTIADLQALIAEWRKLNEEILRDADTWLRSTPAYHGHRAVATAFALAADELEALLKGEER